MRRTRKLVTVVVTAMLLTAALPVSAQETEPETPERAVFAISTPYPMVAVEAGDEATFDLAVTAPEPTNVALEATGLPDGWTATFRGGGFEIDGVTAAPTPPEASLDISVPPEAPEGVYDIGVTADAGDRSVSMTLQVRVSALAGGEVTLTPDFPGLRVPAAETASFSVELRNDTPSDLEFEVTSAGPAGWDVTAEPASEPQATTVLVESGGTENINVEATSPPRTEAGQYTITVQASSAETQVEAEMIVEIVGSYSLELTTPDQRLSTEVSSDGSSEVQLVLTNTGTAPIQNIELSADGPTDWEIEFPEPVIGQLEAGQSVSAVATVTPSDNAIAGDYIITFSASSEVAESQVDIRTTVNPSAVWGFIGIALIALTLAGLAWVFRRFGRR
ncbi:MAG TPA: NEW3 domain-containing protein [Acidimicrobiia bacterium]|jgi:uncharacterized membrane protein|nr:NEW3 domain-containing protein [Acidimicrobiia bacterium]